MRVLRRVRVKLVQQAIARLFVSARPSDGLMRLGSAYGGWWVPAGAVGPGATVISVGVGEDTTFDEALVARGCRVWALDPTPRAIAHITRRSAANALPSATFRFLPIGLWTRDESVRFYAPSDPTHVSHSILNLQGTAEWFEAECWSLSRLLKEINIAVPAILKLDIEGAEFEVLHQLVETSLRPDVLCVEIDAPLPEPRTICLLRELRSAGYRLAHSENWNLLFIYDLAPTRPRPKSQSARDPD